MKNLIKVVLFSLIVSNSFATDISEAEKQQTQKAIYDVIYKLNNFSNSRYPYQVKLAFVQQNILPLFDFDYMVEKILPKQAQDNLWLKNMLKQDIVNTILQNLNKTNKQFFMPIGVKERAGNIIITFKVRNFKLDLVMHKNQTKLQIIDVIINNYGLITYYQQKLNRQR
jgi:ABC-type transporter MlaC component